MSILQLLGSEPSITILGSLLGGAWALFKSTECYERIRHRRFQRALHALETAVEETYRAYVANIKASREDGQLTDAEKRRARSIARERALRIARKDGVNLLRELGEDYLDAWMAKLVRKWKRG